MANILQTSEIIFAILLVTAILLQHRGTGLGGAFGGEAMSYRSRRGIERLLLRSTILFAALFLVSVVAQLFI